MMFPSLKSRSVRGTAFIAANLAVLLALGVLVVAPIHGSLQEGEAEIERQTETLARVKTIAQHKPSLPAPDQVASTAEMFQTGPHEGVAAANLQARLKTMSEAAGAKVRSVQGIPARSEGTLRYIGAKLEIFGPLPSVHRAVQAIESAKPFLFVTNSLLKLSPLAARPGNTTEPIIEAQLDIVGAFRPEEAR
jgi:general secretion pathway protein M